MYLLAKIETSGQIEVCAVHHGEPEPVQAHKVSPATAERLIRLITDEVQSRNPSLLPFQVHVHVDPRPRGA